MTQCQCSMRIRLVGDGCRYCQPQEYIDRLLDNAKEDQAELDKATARVAELEAALRPALHDALDLLTLGADSLRECSTRDEAGNDWTGDPEAQAEYERTLRTVEALKRAAALLAPKEPPDA